MDKKIEFYNEKIIQMIPFKNYTAYIAQPNYHKQQLDHELCLKYLHFPASCSLFVKHFELR